MLGLCLATVFNEINELLAFSNTSKRFQLRQLVQTDSAIYRSQGWVQSWFMIIIMSFVRTWIGFTLELVLGKYSFRTSRSSIDSAGHLVRRRWEFHPIHYTFGMLVTPIHQGGIWCLVCLQVVAFIQSFLCFSQNLSRIVVLAVKQGSYWIGVLSLQATLSTLSIPSIP